MFHRSLKRIPHFIGNYRNLKMKELNLHIGSHKTGTTTFQHWLKENRKQLHDHGYYFPITAAVEGCNHKPLAIEVSEMTGNLEKWNELFLELDNNSNMKYIISSEDFSDLRAADVKKLSILLNANFDTVRIYFTARYPHHAVFSHWGLLLKQGYTDCDFTSFITSGYFGTEPFFHLLKYDYRNTLTPWIENFGRDSINVIAYIENQDSLIKIINNMGIRINNHDFLTKTKKRNVSPNKKCTLVMLLCNRITKLNDALSTERKMIISSTVYSLAREKYKESSVMYYPFNNNSVRILNAYYSDSIEWLKTNFDVILKSEIVGEQSGIKYDADGLSTEDLKYWVQVINENMEYPY